MKRLIMFFLICILTGYSCMVCSAENHTSEGERQTTFGIYATYIEGEKNYFTAPVKDGESEIPLPDGTVIKAEGIPEDCLTLVVYPVTERDEDAWKWFLACMEGKGGSIVPYEIYFLNKDGDRLPADGAAVSISLPRSIKTPAVFSLDRDGTVAGLSSETAAGKIIFRTDGSRYYVIAESQGTVTPGETEPTTTPTPGGETEPTTTPTPGTNGNNPGTGGSTGTGTTTQGTGAQTGDETNSAFWLFALVSSAVCMAGAIFRRRRAS